MIVPHDAQGQPISFKVPASWLYAGVFTLVFCLLLVGSSIVYSTLISRRLIGYSQAIAQNQKQEARLSAFSQKTAQLLGAIDQLVSEENNLRQMLGLKSWKNQARLPFDLKSSPEAKDKISLELGRAAIKLSERRESLDELKSWVKRIQERLADTPTSWPIHGRITSGFGYRSYPWRGTHKGVDIQAQYGAPIRATADGVVASAGWIRGYGKTVVLSHQHGLSTIYGHCSRFNVAPGQKVARGQVVGFVGLTGWTTGAHLHYEVRKFETAQNPMAYLDMNVLSASRMWRGKNGSI